MPSIVNDLSIPCGRSSEQSDNAVPLLSTGVDINNSIPQLHLDDLRPVNPRSRKDIIVIRKITDKENIVYKIDTVLRGRFLFIDVILSYFNIGKLANCVFRAQDVQKLLLECNWISSINLVTNNVDSDATIVLKKKIPLILARLQGIRLLAVNDNARLFNLRDADSSKKYIQLHERVGSTLSSDRDRYFLPLTTDLSGYVLYINKAAVR